MLKFGIQVFIEAITRVALRRPHFKKAAFLGGRSRPWLRHRCAVGAPKDPPGPVQ
jgi:hypothetical protein